MKDGDYVVLQWNSWRILTSKAWKWVEYKLDPLMTRIRLREERN